MQTINANERLDRILNGAKRIFNQEIKAIRWDEKLDKIRIPITVLKFNDEDMKKFNEFITFLMNDEVYEKGIRFCRSGSLPTNSIDSFFNRHKFDIVRTTSCIEIYVIGFWCFRIQFRSVGAADDETNVVYGRQAYRMFIDQCRHNRIDLEKEFAIKNIGYAFAIKKTIPIPPVWVDKKYIDQELDNVHHIDLNSSYMSGIYRDFPILRPVIQYFYDGRKEHPEFKSVLNATTGFFQSRGCNYKYSQLAKSAITFNNDYLNYLTKQLEKTGRKVIAKNTDGIWYQGEIYHDQFEGHNLKQYKNDHINCKIRFKSAGVYEYLENGKYHPVVRGKTPLDDIKPRTEWNWGDIYSEDTKVIKYKYDETTNEITRELEG